MSTRVSKQILDEEVIEDRDARKEELTKEEKYRVKTLQFIMFEYYDKMYPPFSDRMEELIEHYSTYVPNNEDNLKADEEAVAANEAYRKYELSIATDDEEPSFVIVNEESGHGSKTSSTFYSFEVDHDWIGYQLHEAVYDVKKPSHDDNKVITLEFVHHN